VSAFVFPSRLYAILDLDQLHAAKLDALMVLSDWLGSGVKLVQLRAKSGSDAAFLDLAGSVTDRCHRAGAVAIVNDRPDIAVMAGADGVHIGQDDLAATKVRELVGASKYIGLSTHTDEQLEAACREPIDYLAVGPVFPTTTKASSNALVGLDGVARASSRAKRAGIPLVAIGGITLATARSVIAAGADAVAVISGLISEDPGRRARDYLKTV